ncbi:hypothetical protein JCM8097_004245 [Rhodosporidiobolus ruineniae]
MASTRLLSSIDPNLPPRPSSSSSLDHPDSDGSASGSDSMPATPSKDKMREWTFPRSSSNTGATSSGPSSSSALGRSSSAQSAASDHARSSSIAPGASSSTSPKKAHRDLRSIGGGGAGGARGGAGDSRDFRHRTNASLAFAPTPEIGTSPSGRFASPSPSGGATSPPFYPSSSPSSSRADTAGGEGAGSGAAGVAKLVYTNFRRRGLSDAVFLVVFGSALLLFSRAILGLGYAPSAPSSSSALDYASSPAAAQVVDVRIPATFQHPTEEEEGEVPADVHQPYGDSSHDDGVEHFGATDEGWEGVTADDEAHDHPDPLLRPPSDPALFPPHDAAEDSLHAEHAAAVRRPRPARLPTLSDEEAEEEGATTSGHDHASDLADEILLDDEEEDEVDLSNDGIAVGSDDPDDPIEDDTIALDLSHPAVHADGSLHLAGSDAEAEEDEALTALEELLDAAAEEEEEQEQEGEGRDEAGLEAIERAARARGEARGRGVEVGGGVGERRMVRRVVR